MAANTDPFSNLKDVIANECQNADLETLKSHFKKDIASKRAFSLINSPEELLAILEERDCISNECVSYLSRIGTILDNQKILDSVQTYKKLYCKEKEECSICHIDPNEPHISLCEVVIGSPRVSYSEDSQPYLPSRNCIQRTGSTNDLDEAISLLSSKLSKSWPVLARELDLTEKQIDKIRQSSPGNYDFQAERALVLWRNENQANATIDALNQALNNRLCKREGLGSHLLHMRLNPIF